MSIEQIRVQLPDGSVREVARGTTPFDIANSISPRLAAVVVVARVKPLRQPTLCDEAAKDGPPGCDKGGPELGVCRLINLTAYGISVGKRDSGRFSAVF